MKSKNLFYSVIALSVLSLFMNGCKKDKKDSAAPTTTTTTNTASSEYYVKYTLQDTVYSFKSKQPSCDYGTEEATCRIGIPGDFYTGIDISLETPYGVNLIYADIKAMEGKDVPLKCTDSIYTGISARIETLTPDTYYSYQVDYATQKGRFHIEKVTQIANQVGSTHKVLEVKGTFYCNLWPDSPDTVAITNGSFLIKLALWPE
jgi:hypothetical protein